MGSTQEYVENATYETATDRYITVDGVKYAYRHFGNTKSGAPSLLFHVHFKGNMDWWDPALVNPIAARRPVLLFDNAGIGRSEGQVGETFTEWSRVAASIVKSLGLTKVDVFGFSMGGMAALTMPLDYPDLVRRLIIGGASPSQGEGIESADSQYVIELAGAEAVDANEDPMIKTFFSWSEKKRQLGQEWWARMSNSRKDRAPLATGDAVQRQIGAVMRYLGGEYREEGTYDRLDQIKIPVLVANGSNDILVPTHNSYVLFKKLVNAEPTLHLYPDSGHGFLDEYHEHFSNLVNNFLDE